MKIINKADLAKSRSSTDSTEDSGFLDQSISLSTTPTSIITSESGNVDPNYMNQVDSFDFLNSSSDSLYHDQAFMNQILCPSNSLNTNATASKWMDEFLNSPLKCKPKCNSTPIKKKKNNNRRVQSKPGKVEDFRLDDESNKENPTIDSKVTSKCSLDVITLSSDDEENLDMSEVVKMSTSEDQILIPLLKSKISENFEINTNQTESLTSFTDFSVGINKTVEATEDKTNLKRKLASSNLITTSESMPNSQNQTTASNTDSYEGLDNFAGDLFTRKRLRGFCQLTRASIKAERVERERSVRLLKKRKEIEAISNEYPEKIILDYDPKTEKILVEVDSAFGSVLKQHQVEGVRFMFDCTIESVKRFQNEKEEEKEVKKGASFGCILAHCMGLGKTLQVIVFVNTILTNRVIKERIEQVLIIVPLNVLKNWENEFDYWFERCKPGSRRKFQLFILNTAQTTQQRIDRLIDWRELGGVMLTTSRLLASLCEDDAQKKPVPRGKAFRRLLLDPGPDMVIIDEGHTIKNPETCINKVVSRMRTLRRICLTGTPLQNNLREYHSVINFVKPDLLGTLDEFKNRFENPILNGQYIDSTEMDVYMSKIRYHVLHRVTNLCIHRRDYLILVEHLKPIVKCEYVLSVKMSKAQEQLYQHYLDAYVFISKRSARKRLFVHFRILGFIWNHPALLIEYFRECEKRLEKQNSAIFYQNQEDDEFDDDKIDPKEELLYVRNIIGDWPYQFIPQEHDPALYDLELGPKFKLLLSILEECEQVGDKLLIFSHSLHVLSMIEKILKTKKSTHNSKLWAKNRDYFRIDGSVNVNERESIIEQINDEDNLTARLLLISTLAGGVGINLIGANRAIIFDAWWNPATDVQAIYRIFRFGQKKQIFVYRFAAAGTMESKIYKRQITKQSIALRALDQFQIERYFTRTDLHELFDLIVDSEQKDLPLPSKDPLLVKLFASHRDLITDYHEHDSLLENRPDENLTEEEQNKAWQEFEKEQNEQPVVVESVEDGQKLDLTEATLGIVAAITNTQQTLSQILSNQTQNQQPKAILSLNAYLPKSDPTSSGSEDIENANLGSNSKSASVPKAKSNNCPKEPNSERFQSNLPQQPTSKPKSDDILNSPPLTDNSEADPDMCHDLEWSTPEVNEADELNATSQFAITPLEPKLNSTSQFVVTQDEQETILDKLKTVHNQYQTDFVEILREILLKNSLHEKTKLTFTQLSEMIEQYIGQETLEVHQMMIECVIVENKEQSLLVSKISKRGGMLHLLKQDFELFKLKPEEFEFDSDEFDVAQAD